MKLNISTRQLKVFVPPFQSLKQLAIFHETMPLDNIPTWNFATRLMNS